LDAKEVTTVSDRLREIAFKNKDPLARTRSKLLLQYYQERSKPGFHPEDDRSIMEVLLDIEREVKKLPKNK
jgi:hypothetical protein